MDETKESKQNSYCRKELSTYKSALEEAREALSRINQETLYAGSMALIQRISGEQIQALAKLLDGEGR